MAQGIFLNVIDISILNGVTYRQAQNIYRNIRASLEKPSDKKITAEEYAAYEMIPVQLVKEKLKIA